MNQQLNQTELISGSDIERNGVTWGSVDNFVSKLKEGQPLILNTDLSSGRGIHWIVLYPKGRTVHIIDSLGKSNKRPYDDLMFALLKRSGYNVSFYPYDFQYKASNHCGWFALYVAKLLQQGKTNNINALIENVFGQDADDEDIKKVIKGFGLNGNILDKTFDGF